MLEVSAQAKINLTLEVLGRRDDGYHQVRTILQTVDLADRLVIDPSSGLQVECDQPEINGESNLVWTAATALADHCGISPRARIVIKKGIPVSMGLGGGSSDAAAALIALNEMWELGLSHGDLAGIAAGIGSDVAFFLTGGTALAEGRGELITQLPALPSIALTLICPGATLSRKTAVMYSWLNLAHYSDGGSHQTTVVTPGKPGDPLSSTGFSRVLDLGEGSPGQVYGGPLGQSQGLRPSFHIYPSVVQQPIDGPAAQPQPVAQ